MRKHSMDKYHFLRVLLQLCTSVSIIVLGQDMKCITTGRSAQNCEKHCLQHINFLFYCQSKGTYVG